MADGAMYGGAMYDGAMYDGAMYGGAVTGAPEILIVEDEPGLVMTLTDRLCAEQYHCHAESDGVQGFLAAKKRQFDLILLDVMLPNKNGYDICRDLRSAGIRTPILMLTARGQIIDRVLGLKLGADDYLCKPFDMAELLARIEALLRRSASEPNQGGAPRKSKPPEPADKRGSVHFGDFSIDFNSGIVEREGERIALSAQEFKLIAFLTDHPNEIFSRDRLLDTVWGYGSETTTRTVDVHIAWIRKKIGDAEALPRHIFTIRGLGYKFVP